MNINSLALVRLVITDVDGVLTDGSIYYTSEGEYFKCFHVRDGMGISMLKACGVEVAFVSGRDSESLRKRIKDLDIRLVSLGVQNKASACHRLMQQAGVNASQTLFIGDDTIDLPAFAVCGFSCTVSDAPDYIKERADYVLSAKGGQAAFRELSDSILKSQGKESVFESYEGYAQIVDITIPTNSDLG